MKSFYVTFEPTYTRLLGRGVAWNEGTVLYKKLRKVKNYIEKEWTVSLGIGFFILSWFIVENRHNKQVYEIAKSIA